MVKKLLTILLVLIAGFAAVVAMQPSAYRITRSQAIAAPQADVFALVNDFHKWDGWSPWAKLDPAMKTTHQGPDSGTGAIYTWSGNDQVGEGKMTILESQPSDRVKIKLDFLKPFESTSITEFTLKPSGEQTTVEWSMTGENNFMEKAFMMFMGGMDKAVGTDFEKGLAQMKALAEKR
jgi:hypothetical protein